MILVDASRSMAWRGSLNRLTKRAYADRLAAALALILLRQRDATGLITFDDVVREVVPARVKAGQWARLVRGLVDTPDGQGTAAQAALVRLTSLLARRGLVVLVSDLLFDRELALTALRYLRHRGHQVIVLHTMDPAEAELSGPPDVRYREPDSSPTMVGRRRALRRAAHGPGRREVDAWRAPGRRVAARAAGPRRDPRQLPVVRAGGGRASRARAPESDGARLAGAGDGVRSSLARARRRRGARGNQGSVAGDRG